MPNVNGMRAVQGFNSEKVMKIGTLLPKFKLNFGARSFRVAAPTVWNSLPADIRACTFYGSFTRQLKTFYFNNAF